MLLLPNVPISDESNYYTSPIKMFEYMASGVPIIASDLPSLREVLDESNAVLVEAGNPQKLEEAITSLVSDTARATHISRKAFADVQRYSWDNQVKALHDFIASL